MNRRGAVPMRCFRVTRASRPALLALRVGPRPRTWTAHILEDLNVLGYRSSTSRTYSGQHLQSPTSSKRWVFIAGAPPSLSKLVRLCHFTGAGAAQYSTGGSRGSRRKDPSLLYGAGWEGGGEDVAVAVWWDFENCNVPQGIEVYKVGVNIVSGLRLSGFKGPVSISAYGDTVQLSRTTQEALASTGIRLHHIPSGGKDSSDRALLVDLILWTLEHPPPAHLFLISGDRDFSNALHRLRMRNYNILLACPAGTTVSPALLGAATHVWQWNSLVRGEGLLLATTPDFRPPDGSPGGASYPRHGGPRPYSPSYLPPVSRGYDGSGHSSDGGGVPTPPTPAPTIPSPSMQSRTVEGNGSSVAVVKKPATAPVSPSQSTQKQALKDTTQASVASEEGSSAKPILRRPPQKLLQQFKCLLSSHPNGMTLSDLQNYIREGKLSLEKDFYGHGKVVPFLSSIPEIVRLERVLMKDNKSWSYILLTPSQDGSKSRTEGSHTVKELGAQTQSCRQAIEQTPAASQASSQPAVTTSNSTGQMQQEKPESLVLSPLALSSTDQRLEKILSIDAQSKAGQTKAQAFEGEVSTFPQSDTQRRDHGKDDKEVDLPSVSKTQASASESNQKTTNVSETAVPTFLRSLVDALRNLQTKKTGVEDPNLPQQVDGQLKISDTSLELVRGKVEVDGPSHAEEIAEAGIKRGNGGVSGVDASSVLSGDKQLVSEGMYESSEVVTNNGASSRQANNLESELSQSGGPESSSNIVRPVVEEERRPAWKRWLFGPPSEEASSTSGVEFRASPELNRASQSDAVTPCLGSEEGKADSKSSADSFSTSEEVITPQTKSASRRTGTTDGRDEESLWGHSFVIQNSKGDGTRTMKVWEDLKEYVSSAEGTLLLSDASNLMEAVNLIKMKGPLQFRYLDSNEISDIIRPFLVEVKGGIHWESLDEGLTTEGSVSNLNGQLKAQVLNARPGDLFHPSAESLRGHSAVSLVESKNHVHSDFQQEGKEMSNEIKSDDGYRSIMLKEEEIDGNARDKPSPEEGAHVCGQEALQGQIGPITVVSPTHVDEASSKNRNGDLPLASFDREDSSAVCFEDTPDSGQQSSEPSTSHSSPTTSSINQTPPVHPSFGEFEEWFLGAINNAYRRSGRNQRAGYDLSLVKPDFEREFGVRLDPKAYGYSRVQDLVASISSVRLSRPRIDQCVIHLLKFDAEVQELANQYLEEQVEETVVTKSQIWPKMFHDCKSLVRELMMENPDGVAGITLKPLFASRFNYPLDHRRVGYQRMSDLLRLMSDVVSVNGNFLVPSGELLRTMRKEAKVAKRLPENVMLEAGSENSLDDEFSPETRSQIGENWSEIDKEANGSSSSEDTNAQLLSEDGRRSSDMEFSESRAFEKLSNSREVLDDLCSSSEDESDFANEASEEVDSQAEQFQSFVEEFQQKELRRTPLSQVSEETEARGSTRSSRPSREYDFSQEIDKFLLEDDHVEQWMAENRPGETQQDTADSSNSESDDTQESPRLTLDGHLHEDWSAELLKDHIQQPNDEPGHSYSHGSDEETYGVVESPAEGQSPETSGAGDEHESVVEDTSTSGSDIASRDRDGLGSVTSTSVERSQEEYNSKSLELMRILQRNEQPLKLVSNSYFSESPQVGLSREDSTDESEVGTSREESSESTRESDSSPRDTDVYCHTPSSEGARPDPKAPNTQEEEKVETENESSSATENGKYSSSKDKSGDIIEEVQEGDNPRGSSSSDGATRRSIWRRLFK